MKMGDVDWLDVIGFLCVLVAMTATFVLLILGRLFNVFDMDTTLLLIILLFVLSLYIKLDNVKSEVEKIANYS